MSEFRDRRELTMDDIIPNHLMECPMQTYGRYEMLYKQDSNQLHRFPELLSVFKYGELEKGNGWGYMRFLTNSSNIYLMGILQVLYDAFSESPHIAIDKDSGLFIEIVSHPKHVGQTFKVYRNRCLFSVRDYLGISHDGKGKDSIRL